MTGIVLKYQITHKFQWCNEGDFTDSKNVHMQIVLYQTPRLDHPQATQISLQLQDKVWEWPRDKATRLPLSLPTQEPGIKPNLCHDLYYSACSHLQENSCWDANVINYMQLKHRAVTPGWRVSGTFVHAHVQYQQLTWTPAEFYVIWFIGTLVNLYWIP